MYVIGIDIGSLTTKVALVNDGQMVDVIIGRSTYNFKKVGRTLFDKILNKNGLTKEDIRYVLSTGYGRHSIDFSDSQVTEITAHARGVQYFFPDVRSIIDIGGQDSKVIVISKKSGKVLDFQMNDKCAAGTGRFLEVMAGALEVDISEFGNLALSAKKTEQISSMCTIFAESEVISLFAKGKDKADIAMGIHKSIAKRVASMAKRLNVSPPIVFCGGVALNPALTKVLGEELGCSLITPGDPQITGALGAALIAHSRLTTS